MYNIVAIIHVFVCVLRCQAINCVLVLDLYWIKGITIKNWNAKQMCCVMKTVNMVSDRYSPSTDKNAHWIDLVNISDMFAKLIAYEMITFWLWYFTANNYLW